MSHVDPFYSEQSDDWGQYSLIGPFDGMRIDIFEPDKLHDFVTSADELLSDYNNDANKNKRLLFQPAVQRQFFCMQEADDESWENKTLLESYRQGKGKPFISLITVKLHYQYSMFNRCGVDICERVKAQFRGYMESIGITSPNCYDCIVMPSLSADDVYILIGMDNPWFNEVMGFTLSISDWECNFTCTEGGCSSSKKHSEKISKAYRKTAWDTAYEKLLKLEPQVFEIYAHSALTYEGNRISAVIGEKLKTAASFTRNEIDSYTSAVATLFNNQIDDTESSHAGLSLLYEYINTIRFFGPVPVTLQTYSLFGYKKDLYRVFDPNGAIDAHTHISAIELITTIATNIKNHGGCEDVDLHYRLSLRSGTNYNDFYESFNLHLRTGCTALIEAFEGMDNSPEKDLILPYKNEIASLLPHIGTTIGRYDYALRVTVSPVVLMFLYTQIFRKWHPDGPMMWVQKACGTLSLPSHPVNRTTTPRSYIVNEMKLNYLWVKEQQSFAADLFSRLSQNDDIKNNLPLIHLVDELSVLHLQGCQSFFSASSWSEFSDAQRFFVSFYQQLKEILIDDLQSEEYAMYKDIILHDMQMSMRIAIASLSGLFHDRMITDMSMRTNTRPGVYAAGSYEMLIKGYSVWMERINNLLKSMEGKSKWEEELYKDGSLYGLSSILVPVESDETHSHSLFPMRVSGKGRQIIYEMPLIDMLNFNMSMPTLVHELGHYWGVLNRPNRVKTCIDVISYLFAQYMANELRKHNHFRLPFNTLTTATEKLRLAMRDYLTSKTKGVNGFMHHVGFHFKQAMNDFVKHALVNPDRDMKKLLKALSDLYYEADAVPLVADKGWVFYQLILEVCENALRQSQLIQRECYADLVMATALGMEPHEAVEWLIYQYQQEDPTKGSPESSEAAIELSNLYNICAIRIMSIITLTSSSDFALRESLGMVGQRIEEHEHRWSHNKVLTELLATYYNKEEVPHLNDMTMAWSYISMYLHKSREMMLKHFPSPNELKDIIKNNTSTKDLPIDEAKNLHWVRELYSSTKNASDSMRQLAVFLTKR